MFKHIKNIVVAGALMLPALSATAADYQINRFTVTPDKWNTNSYWLESEEGIVLIDGQLLIEDAKHWANMIKATGKPVKGLIVTHAHPDHYGGLNTLRKELGHFPIITTEATANSFEEAHKLAMNFTAPFFKDRFDAVQLKPDQIVGDNAEITLAGITLKIEDIGPGESLNATLIYEPTKKVLFSGDATMHHGHVYTGEARSEEFLRQLNHIKTKYKDVDFIYAGHGDPARVTHVDQQITYIKDIQVVATQIFEMGDYRTEDGQRFNGALLQKHAATITKKYPGLSDYGFPDIQIAASNIAGVIRELESKAEAVASN